MIFAGFGGQGVMLIGQLVAYAAMKEGKQVSWFPSYGPEMRGGTANCAVVVADEPVGSPVVGEPTAVVAMNGPSLNRFLPMVRSGGLMIYNSSMVDGAPNRDDITILAVPANEIAVELGEIKAANMVALGALIGKTSVISVDQALAFLADKLAKYRDLLPVNREALHRGLALAR